MRKMITVFFLCLMAFTYPAAAERVHGVEIFDLKQEKVVKTVPLQPALRKEAASYLANITGLYTKVKPIPEAGYIVRVPLIPSVPLQNQWVKTEANEVLIVIPTQGPPVLLVFTEEKKPYFFLFKGDIQRLWKLLKFQAQ